MTVKIRLKRTGRKKDAHYKVVAVDSRKKRDGSVLEYLGHYHPQDNFPNLEVDLERYEDFKSKGARVSDTVRTLVNKLRRGAVEEEKPVKASPPEKSAEKEQTEITPEGEKPQQGQDSEEAGTEEKEDLKQQKDSSEETGEEESGPEEKKDEAEEEKKEEPAPGDEKESLEKDKPSEEAAAEEESAPDDEKDEAEEEKTEEPAPAEGKITEAEKKGESATAEEDSKEK